MHRSITPIPGDVRGDNNSEETEHNDMLSALDEDDALRDDDYNNAEKIGTRNVIDNALENDM